MNIALASLCSFHGASRSRRLLAVLPVGTKLIHHSTLLHILAGAASEWMTDDVGLSILSTIRRSP